MVKLITYEVYTMAPNGGWYLHSRFSSEQRADAFDLGKNIERLEGLPTKIVKETYDSNTRRNDDTVLYISPKIRAGTQRPRSKKYFGGGYRGEIPSLIYEEDEKQDVSFGRAVWVFILILLMSFFIASLSSLVAVLILSRYTDATSETGTKFTFIVFVITFILSSIPMSKKFIPWNRIRYNSSDDDDEDEPFRRLGGERRQSFSDRIQRMIYAFLLLPDTEKTAAPVLKQEESVRQPAEWGSGEEGEVKNVFETQELSREENPFTQAVPLEESSEDALKNFLEPKKVEETAEVEEEEEKEKQDDAPKPVDVIYESYKKQMVFFVKEVALTLKSGSIPITAFTKFGFNLLIVGAIDNVREKSSLSEENIRELLTDSFLLLGVQPHLTDTFYEKIGAYTLNPAYLQMMQHGKEIMVEMSVQSSDLREGILSAFKEWLKPTSREHNIITVMFTDITSSTSITQEVGDEKAYELVKVHNGIVRKALQEMQGREIKHTGDGIMASFLSAVNAVKAAVLIQRLANSYNKNNKDLPLNLKIGLSAGEPIREGQDLFGATVQIASRLCAHADSGQILVSKEIKDLNANTDQVFKKTGEEGLKGLKTPIEIYEAEYVR